MEVFGWGKCVLIATKTSLIPSDSMSTLAEVMLAKV